MTQAATLRRLADWPARLASHVHAHAAAPFGWGRQDCATFAAGAVAAITGAKHLLPWRWQSAAQARRVLRAGGGLAAMVGQVLPELPSVALAWRGDVVLVRHPQRPRRPWLAVCDGHRWLAPARHGLTEGPMDMVVQAWGVGHAGGH